MDGQALKPGVQPPKRRYDVLLPVASAAVLDGAKPGPSRKSPGRRGATLSALDRNAGRGQPINAAPGDFPES